MNRITFIYSLTDPRDGRVRYVGKSGNPNFRMNHHIQSSRSEEDSSARAEWLREVARGGATPTMAIIETVTGTSTDATEAEKKWIARYREQGCDLVNFTKGSKPKPRKATPNKPRLNPKTDLPEPPEPFNIPDYMAVRDVAKEKNVSRAWVYEAIITGRLPAYRFVNITIVARADAQKWGTEEPINRGGRPRTRPHPAPPEGPPTE